MTLNRGTRKPNTCIAIFLMLRILLEDSRQDIGRFSGLDQKRNGTESMSTNLMENGENC